MAFAACVFGGGIALAHVSGVTLCPMKRFLNIPCPTCGATRAAVLLLHGDVAGAFAMQPLASIVLTVVLPAIAGMLLFAGRRRTKAILSGAARRSAFWGICAVAVMANWAYVIWRKN